MKMTLNNVKLLSANISKAQELNRRLRACCGQAEATVNPDMEGVVAVSKRIEWFRSMCAYERLLDEENEQLSKEVISKSKSDKFIEDILAAPEIVNSVSRFPATCELVNESNTMQSALNRQKVTAFQQKNSTRIQRMSSLDAVV